MRRIETDADILEGLGCLLAADARLPAIRAAAGPLPLRRRSGGFEGLAVVVTAQQISTAAAGAIWARLQAAVQPFTPGQLLLTSEDALRVAGLSRPKIRTLRAVATALGSGFDLDTVGELPSDDAIAALVSLDGIGTWTAESYLLFCLGHPDVFPAGDLALQVAVQHGFGLPERPRYAELRRVAGAWSPWQAVAARLFWAYYAARRAEMRESRAAGAGGVRGAPAKLPRRQSDRESGR